MDKMMNSEQTSRHSRKKGIFTGLAIITLGVLWLLKRMDVGMPEWVFSWQMILIVLGLFSAFAHNFRKPFSFVLIGVGVFFLLDDFYLIPISFREYFWPVLVILVGIAILFRPKTDAKSCRNSDRFRNMHHIDQGIHVDDTDIPGNVIDTVSIFNGLKKNIQSKDFKGGETVTVFAGTEINMTQSDFHDIIYMDNTVVFGGLKLIVPPNWEVRTNVTSIMAGVEDKRNPAVEVIPDKVLVLTGTVLFGGIDIVSY